jgi:hypothetical protein
MIYFFDIWTSIDLVICVNNCCSTFSIKKQTVTFFLAVSLSVRYCREVGTKVTQSVHIIIVNNEGEIEGEVDEGPEQRFRHQKHKVPHVVRQIVDLWSIEQAIKEQILPEFSNTRLCEYYTRMPEV